MAKKITSIDPTAGVSARDILAFASGKKSGELNVDDIRSLAVKQGISPKDTARILAGAHSFLGSGNDYRLTGDNGFNVVNPQTGPLTSSSRKAGNKKGFNAGDLVGLGNNVSTLMGLAGRYRKDFDSKPTGESPVTSVTEAPREIAKQTPASLLGTKPGKQAVVTAGKSTSPQQAREAVKTPTAKEYHTGELAKYRADRFKQTPYAKYVNMDQVTPQDFDENIIHQKLTQYSDMIMSSLAEGDKEPAGLLKDTIGPSSFNKYERNITDSNLEKLLDDYKHNLKLGYDIKPPHEDFFTRGKYAGNSEDLASNSELATDMLLMGTGPKIAGSVAKGLALGNSHPTMQFLRYYLSRNAPLPNAVTSANLLSKASSMGTRTASQIAMAPVKKTAENLMKKGADRVKFPEIVKEPLQLGPKVKPRFKVQGEGVPMEKPRFKVKGFSGRPSAVPGTPNYIPKGEFADGGKIMWGTPQSKKFAAGGVPKFKAPTIDTEFDTSTPDFIDNPKYNYEAATVDSTGGGNYGVRNPKSGIDFSGGEGKGGDIAGKVAKYALPFVGEGLARQEYAKYRPSRFEPVDLMKGVVTDLPRPNMRLRYREPVGPDVQSEVGGQKFADSQQTDKEVNFAIQNALSRQQQREHILDRTNQGIMFDAQGKRMQSIYGDQIRAQFTGARAESMRQPFIAAQQHLATDIADNAYLQTDKKTALATEIIRNRDRYSPEQVQQAEAYLGGSRIKGAKGMKFRNKFSAYAH